MQGPFTDLLGTIQGPCRDHSGTIQGHSGCIQGHSGTIQGANVFKVEQKVVSIEHQIVPLYRVCVRRELDRGRAHMEPESHTPGASQRGISATDGRAYGPARRCDGRAGGKERGGLAGYVSAGNLAQCSAGLEK